MGKPKPKNKHLIEISPTYSNHPHITPRELQIGDIIFYSHKRRFGILLKFDKVYWTIESRSGKIFRSRGKNLKLICNNLRPSKMLEIAPNLLNLKTFQEINYAEHLNFIVAEKYIEKISLSKIAINKKTLCVLHHFMFNHVYDWAGNFRQEELVVGRYDSPTLEWKCVPEAISDFFKQFDRIYQRITKNHDLFIQRLVFFHQQLAWIHPFKDGNGRLIRLMCNLSALKEGYKLDWHLEKGKVRKQYQHAVRYAVNHQKTSQLSYIISRSLKEITH